MRIERKFCSAQESGIGDRRETSRFVWIRDAKSVRAVDVRCTQVRWSWSRTEIG